MIEGRRGEVDHILPVKPEISKKIVERKHVRRGLGRQRANDALGPTGGTGGVEHGGAEPFLGERRLRKGGDGALVVLVARFVGEDVRAVDHQYGLDARAIRQRFLRHRKLFPGGNEHLGFGILENVGEFAARQIGIDAGVIEAAALASGAGFQVGEIVLHKNRVMI